MSLEFCSRNNDISGLFPTFQERINAMLPSSQALNLESTSAAQELASQTAENSTLAPTSNEIVETLAQVEEKALKESEEILQIHAGLNEQRVARLLGLLN